MSQTMSRSACRVPTQHGSRYLQQLCKHWAHKFEVEFGPEQGRIAMSEDRVVTLEATPETLVIGLSAPADVMEHLQHVVDSHIVRFAFREELSFDWQAA